MQPLVSATDNHWSTIQTCYQLDVQALLVYVDLLPIHTCLYCIAVYLTKLTLMAAVSQQVVKLPCALGLKLKFSYIENLVRSNCL
jgi:hypothetical protein